MIYCLDTNTLIHSWRFWYTRRTHPSLWEAFLALAATGALKIPLQVYEELDEREDALFDWFKQHKDMLVFEPTASTEAQYRVLANEYPALTGGLGLKQDYADLYVVAVAMVEDATVVTHEDIGFRRDPNRRSRSQKNYKITNVCFEKGVELIRIYEVLRRQGWVFRHGA